jgi:hypothetical protein
MAFGDSGDDMRMMIVLLLLMMVLMFVCQGMKSPTERFAGADETFTIEALMQNGWALQSG